jgi:hypothetical protein
MLTLSNSQLKFISDVLVSLGQVFVASLIVEYFIRSMDISFLFLGIFLTLGCLVFGLFINKNINF